MKVKFLMDHGEYKAGAMADLEENQAEELHQAGIAYPIYDEVKVEEKPAKKGKK